MPLVSRDLLRSLGLVGVVVATLTSGGCGSAPKLVPVKGKVLVNGQPATGAFVQFHLIDGDPKLPRPAGRVKEDGSFQLSTLQVGEATALRSGAPPGHYQVTVMLRTHSAHGDSDEYDLLPTRYLYPTTSGLTALVKEERTELPPLELTNP